MLSTAGGSRGSSPHPPSHIQGIANIAAGMWKESAPPLHRGGGIHCCWGLMPRATNEFQRAFTSILSYVKVMNIAKKLGHHIPHTVSQSCAVDKMQQCWWPFPLSQPALGLACGIVAGQSVTLHLFEAILYGSKNQSCYKVKIQCWMPLRALEGVGCCYKLRGLGGWSKGGWLSLHDTLPEGS